MPSNHLQGRGCRACSYRSNTEEFIQKAIAIHGDKYSYRQVEYEMNWKKVKIICPIHGAFEMQPANHLNRQGCEKCNNKEAWMHRSKGRPATFYILKCQSKDETFFKIGITFRNIKIRCCAIPYTYEIIKEIKSNDLSLIWDMEECLKILLSNKYIPKIKFGGYTESFS